MDPSIIWDSEDDEQGNYHHIVAEGHGITQEAVDEVLREHHSEAATSRTTGSPICFGWTTTGKYIAVVFEESCDDPLMLYPITAYEAPSPEGREDDMTSKGNKPTANGPDQPRRPARTAEDLARYKAIRERFQQEKPSLEELVSSGEYNEPLPMGEHLSIRQAVFALRKAREAAGLSLADVAERTGIDKAALSRIETGQHPNPTVSTLCRYAHALGKRWKWVLEGEAIPARDTTGVRPLPRGRPQARSGGPAMLAVWDRVRQLQGATLATLHRARPFTVVAVEDDCVRVLPQDGKGTERSVRRDRVEHVAGLGLPRDELRRRVAQEYPDSQNTSYIAALAYEATRPVVEPSATADSPRE